MEETDLLSPLVDVVFKALFGNPKNTDILASFIKAVLNTDDDEFDELEISDTNLKIEHADDKVGILDIKVYTKGRKIINVEVQILPMPEFRERIIFYSSKMVTEQIGKGEDYGKIHKVISIIILDYKLIEGNDKYHNIFQLYEEDTKDLFSDILEIHVLELTKLGEEDNNSNLIKWLKFFKAKKKGDFEMIAMESPELQKAFEELLHISQDENMRERYEARMKEQRDWISRLKGAEKKGLKQGEEKGIKAFIMDNEEEAVPQNRIVEKLQIHFEIDENTAIMYYQKFRINKG